MSMGGIVQHRLVRVRVASVSVSWIGVGVGRFSQVMDMCG